MEILSTGVTRLSQRVRATWLLLLCSGLWFLPADASAQMESPSGLLLFNATYGFGDHAVTGEKVDGWGFSVAFDAVQRGDYSIGFALGWISFNEIPEAETPPATPENPQPRLTGIDAFPIYLTAKKFFGGPAAKLYIGAGLGGFATKETLCSDTLCSTYNDGGFSFGVPLGFYLFPSEDVFFNVGYVLNWMSDSVLQSDIGHVINLGVGFQFGM